MHVRRISNVHCGERRQASEHHEQCCFEEVVRFIDLLGYREITLKSDTEQAIIAFRNRVAEMCNAEVTTEGALKGDQPSNGLIENSVMLLRGIIRTIKFHTEKQHAELIEDSAVLPWLAEYAGIILSRCQKGRGGRKPFQRLHGKKPSQEFVPFGEKVLAMQISRGLWILARKEKQQCRMPHW